MSFSNIYIKNNIRIYLSDLTSIAQEAIKLHKTSPLSSLVIATAIACFAPFAIIKARGKTVAMIKSDGLIKNVIVEANAEGNVRALVGETHIVTDYDNQDINSIPLKLAIGEKGFLRIVQEYDGENFGGEVSLVKGDIVTDLAFYFAQSEQIFSAVIADVKLKDATTIEKAHSVIFQMLPGYTEEDVVDVENFIKNNKLSENELEKYLAMFGGHLVGEKKLHWKCNCNSEKVKDTLKLLSQNEIKDILEKEGKISVTCNFCNRVYDFFNLPF